MGSGPHYRFGAFTLSPGRRELQLNGEPVPLIPRYFELLLFLLERRGEAVSRDAIFDRVWGDVAVSDGALTQAIRTLRRSLGDRPKNPLYIRTVSRHGYQFIYQDVQDIPDGEWTRSHPRLKQPVATEDLPRSDALNEAISKLISADRPDGQDGQDGQDGMTSDDALREAALTIHELGREAALKRLTAGHSRARALLRDARWELVDAGPVPLLGSPGFLTAAWQLVRLRLDSLRDILPARGLGAIVGSAAAGLLGGIGGAVVLMWGPESTATSQVLFALPIVGILIGGMGGLGVAAGLLLAEASVRSARGLALALLGGLGGGVVGAGAHLLGRFTIEGLFGRDLSPVAGGFEGAVIGLATGLGYALATPLPDGGLAAPTGGRRVWVALAAGMTTASACAALGLSGHYLGAMSLDFMAESFPGSQVSLRPLSLLLGESEPGGWTRFLVSAWEGGLFGSGLIYGLTRRARLKTSDDGAADKP